MATSTVSPSYRVQPGPRAGLVVFAIYTAIFIGTLAASGIAYDDLFDTAENAYKSAVLGLGLGTAFLLVFVAWARWDGLWRDPRPLGMHPVLWVPIGLMVASMLLRFADVDWADAGGSLILAVVIAGLMVGFAEETLFRGIFLRSMRTGGRTEAHAAVLTTIGFGFLHLPNALIGGGAGAIAQVVLAGLSGFALYLTRRGTGFILPAMLLHGFWDMSSFLAADHHRDTILGGISQGLYFLNFLVIIAAIAYVWRHDRATRWQRDGSAFDPDAPLVG